MAVGAFICGCGGFALAAEEEAFLRDADPWGFIVFKRNIESPDQLHRLTDRFREIVGRSDAPVLVDQEGGRVQRLGPPHWRRYPAARRFAMAYEGDRLGALGALRMVARLMADDMREAGVTVDCLPVLDVPQPGSHGVIGHRAYSESPEEVALFARAAMSGLMAGGVLPVIKHIPGHGRAMSDSHHALPVVDATADELAQTDFLPFAALADAPMAMTAHVVYTAVDDSRPATLSRKLISGTIRRTIGFDGLLMSDDLSMQALSGTLAERTQGAIAAGCDVVLHCNGNMEEMREVADAAGSLRGKALRRAKAALAMAAEPQPFDRPRALKALARVLESAPNAV